jgi:hypothetical protein
MRMTGGPLLLTLSWVLSSKSRVVSMLAFHLTLNSHENVG